MGRAHGHAGAVATLGSFEQVMGARRGRPDGSLTSLSDKEFVQLLDRVATDSERAYELLHYGSDGAPGRRQQLLAALAGTYARTATEAWQPTARSVLASINAVANISSTLVNCDSQLHIWPRPAGNVSAAHTSAEKRSAPSRYEFACGAVHQRTDPGDDRSKLPLVVRGSWKEPSFAHDICPDCDKLADAYPECQEVRAYDAVHVLPGAQPDELSLAVQHTLAAQTDAHTTWATMAPALASAYRDELVASASRLAQDRPTGAFILRTLLRARNANMTAAAADYELFDRLQPGDWEQIMNAAFPEQPSPMDSPDRGAESRAYKQLIALDR